MMALKHYLFFLSRHLRQRQAGTSVIPHLAACPCINAGQQLLSLKPIQRRFFPTYQTYGCGFIHFWIQPRPRPWLSLAATLVLVQGLAIYGCINLGPPFADDAGDLAHQVALAPSITTEQRIIVSFISFGRILLLSSAKQVWRPFRLGASITNSVLKQRRHLSHHFEFYVPHQDHPDGCQ